MQQAKKFLIITFVISYSMAFAFYIVGLKFSDTAKLVLGVAYMFVPMAVVFYLNRGQKIRTTLKALNFFNGLNWWYLVVLVTPILVAFLALEIGAFMPDVVVTSDMSGMVARYTDLLTAEQLDEMKTQIAELPKSLLLLSAVQAVLLGATINAVAAFGEELGWRGYLLRSFRNLSFAKASIYIGVIWGIWHAPLILMGHNYPSYPVVGVAMMVVFCLVSTPIFNYLMIKSKSILAMAMLHGVVNASYGITILTLSGGNELTVGLTGLAGIIALCLVVLAIYIYDRFVSKQNIMSHKISANIWQDD